MIGRTKGGLNSKLHMVSDGQGRPPTFFLSPGQMSDAKGVGLEPSLGMSEGSYLWNDHSPF